MKKFPVMLYFKGTLVVGNAYINISFTNLNGISSESSSKQLPLMQHWYS